MFYYFFIRCGWLYFLRELDSTLICLNRKNEVKNLPRAKVADQSIDEFSGRSRGHSLCVSEGGSGSQSRSVPLHPFGLQIQPLHTYIRNTLFHATILKRDKQFITKREELLLTQRLPNKKDYYIPVVKLLLFMCFIDGF